MEASHHKALGVLACVVFAGCIEGTENPIDFGGGYNVPPEDGTGGDYGETGTATEADSGGDAPGGDTDWPGGETDDATATTHDPFGGTDTGDGTEGGGADPGGAQPDTGMYADCRLGLECDEVMEHRVCVTYSEGGTAMDGFCSYRPCVDPATDCDPTPGGTAAPKCINLNVDDVPTTVCALDCSLGQTCPAGMLCNMQALGGLCM